MTHLPTTGVVLQDLSHTFDSPTGPVHALRGLSLDVAPGEMVVVKGVSGSGKSTLIGILAGLISVQHGSAMCCGTDLSVADRADRAYYRRHTASVIFQEYNLISSLTAEENVAVPLALTGTRFTAARTRARRALEDIGLDGLADRFPGEMSGGQRQRVAIARAMISRKPLVLADEPTGALDRHTAALVVAMLRDLSHRGCTVIAATHDPAVGDQADRVVEIVDGCLH
ncbi:ABC transporter ATP-binding protein [Nakamurella silvestris]|nr:ABC transporter ATP-binding protein [Nakamurella silvestris]